LTISYIKPGHSEVKTTSELEHVDVFFILEMSMFIC